MMNEFSESFKEEALELLEELETSLMELEKDPDNSALIAKVFRTLHTLKGSGSMFGFEDIAEFTHEMENVFTLVRSGGIRISGTLVGISLKAADLVRSMLEKTGETPAPRLDSHRADIVRALRQLVPPPPGSEEQVEPDAWDVPDDDGLITCRIGFRPPPDIEQKGTRLLDLLKELNSLGPCMMTARWEDVPPLEELEAGTCRVYWDIILTTSRGLNAVRDVFIFVEHDADIDIRVLDDGPPTDDDNEYQKLGDILTRRGDLTAEHIERALADRPRVGEVLVEKGLVEPDRVESALEEQRRQTQSPKQSPRQPPTPPRGEEFASLRVPAEKADRVVNLVGELVTLQAHLAQIAENLDHPGLTSLTEEAERLTWELRDNVMSMRMLPISTIFYRFKRLARDLAVELGKEVDVVLGGGETELDKTVLERLCDPIMHLVRNALVHGIESPLERINRGKAATGTLRISAQHSGAGVTMTISDDGAGIDHEAVRDRAVRNGLLAPDDAPSPDQLLPLLFEAGFSTSRTVTGLSGRGVGLDVVKGTIDSLRGTITLDSHPGEGTTITLTLPLTLAIIDGLLIRERNEHFIIPLSQVREIVELNSEKDNHILNLRDQIIPYINLAEIFEIKGQSAEIRQVVVVESEGRQVGFAADRVIGNHQTVIKSLGKIYRDIRGLSGATIMGDGTVALILDVAGLVRMAENNANRRNNE